MIHSPTANVTPKAGAHNFETFMKQESLPALKKAFLERLRKEPGLIQNDDLRKKVEERLSE